jgi:membrane-associated phospholipid phosphatase
LTLHPHTLAFVYFLYLAVLGVARGHVRARRASVAALIGTTVISRVMGYLPPAPAAIAIDQVWRLVVLLAGYHAAGAFYTAPNVRLEAWLLAIDRRVLGSRVWPPAGRALLEAAYTSVYLVIPAGAAVVIFSATPEAVDRFWTIVLAAGFACYGSLPWIQTRPPRAIEPATSAAASSQLRRLNLGILERGSIGVNTLPSGHAATAAAVALAVWPHAPPAGALFVVVAILIAIATVVGRYHYAVDTVLGVAVGVAAWLVFS